MPPAGDKGRPLRRPVPGAEGPAGRGREPYPPNFFSFSFSFLTWERRIMSATS
jgi:hypothetical protein